MPCLPLHTVPAALSEPPVLHIRAHQHRISPSERMTVQAVAAPAPPKPAVVPMRVVTASDLSAPQLRELTARPRIDFASVLDTVLPCCDTCTFWRSE